MSRVRTEKVEQNDHFTNLPEGLRGGLAYNTCSHISIIVYRVVKGRGSKGRGFPNLP